MKFNIETARYSYKKQIPNTKSEQKSTWKKENPITIECFTVPSTPMNAKPTKAPVVITKVKICA